ncbi:MAG: 6,7-dimethyl-8-ribityllumazine synthase [Pseudomonadota bacterium]
MSKLINDNKATTIAIIVANFYQDIADNIMRSAIDVISEAGYTYQIIDIPGAFELPASLNIARISDKFCAYIMLGCVIRGETSHYDYVCESATRGIEQLTLQHNLSVGFGLITCENMEQALVRSDARQKDVGGKAALAAIHMLKIKNNLI